MNIKEYTDSLANVIPNADLRDRVLGLTVCMLADMKQSVYVVTAVDSGESCDGKARVLGAFKSEADAKAYVRNDMEDYCDQFHVGEPGIVCDFDKMYVSLDDSTDSGCKWNIESVEVK